MLLSMEERVFLVEYAIREGNRYTDLVQERFAEKFTETPIPHRNKCGRHVEKFRETGSMLDTELSGKKSKFNDKELMDISDSMLRSPSKSLLKLAQEKEIGLATAHKAVREKLNLFPYKVTALHEEKLADHEQRIRYCERFTNFIQTKTVDTVDDTFSRDEA
jgi:transposase